MICEKSQKALTLKKNSTNNQFLEISGEKDIDQVLPHP